MIHVYTKSNGLLNEQTAGGDTSRYDPATYGVVEDAEKVAIRDYNYLGGVLTPKITVALIPDKSEIAADDTDQAVVTVQVAGESPPASIELLIGEYVDTVALTDGQGTLDPITASSPCEVAVMINDQITYSDGGGITITAE